MHDERKSCSRGKWIALVLAFSFCFPVLAKKEYTGEEEDDISPIESVRLSFKYILEGNKKDLKANKKRAALFKRKAAEAEKNKSKKAKELVLIAKGFDELATCNELIVKSCQEMGGKGLDDLFARVTKAEKIIRDNSGKEPPREWLTFDEVRTFFKEGYVFKTPHPEILPHHRKNWDTTKYRKRKISATERKKAEAKRKKEKMLRQKREETERDKARARLERESAKARERMAREAAKKAKEKPAQ